MCLLLVFRADDLTRVLKVCLVAIALMFCNGCVGTGSFETGRVLPYGENQVVVGVSLRRDFSTRESREPLSNREPEQLLIFPSIFDLDIDAFWLYRAGLGRGLEGEFGVKSSLLITFLSLGTAHSPGLVFGVKKNVLDDNSWATAVGLRWTTDVLLLGYSQLSNVALVMGVHLRTTASLHDSRERSVYLSPNASYKWVHYANRDESVEEDDWETIQGSAYMLGLNLGALYEPVGAEIGVDYVPTQTGMDYSTAFPRVGVGWFFP